MSRFAWVSSVLAISLVLLLGPGIALAGETKKFEDSNFELTTPADAGSSWSSRRTQTDAGYVTRLGRRDGDAVALLIVRVADTQGLSLAELTEEVRQGLRQGLQTVDKVSVGKGNVAGVEGSRVVITGKNESDMPTMFRAYSIEAKGKFHQLVFTLVADAPTKLAREVDELRRGYKLLSGGGEECPAEEDFLAGKPEASSGGAEGGEGPAQEGRTISFPTHNIKWTLPEGSPFKWGRITDNATAKEGMLVSVEASIEHPPRKGSEDEGPQVNTALVVLIVEPLKPGWEPTPAVKSPGNQTNLEKNFFDRVEYGRTDTVEDLPIGNITGAGLQMVGMKDEHVRYFRWYCASLEGRVVRVADLHRRRPQRRQRLQGPPQGAHEGHRVPWTRSSGSAAPSGSSACRPTTSSGDTTRGRKRKSRRWASRPRSPRRCSISPSSRRRRAETCAWRGKCEPRTRSRTSTSTSSPGPRRVFGRQRTFAEDRIKQREGQWKDQANSPQTIKKGKEPFFKASFNGGKGLGYEFTGYLDDAPFVEEGYVVEYKKHVFWVRFQYGGVDAEKTFKKMVKAIKKGLKFSR